jgi:hypothetical protein
MKTVLFVAVAVLALTGTANSACRQVWDCSRGPCQNRQVCDSTLDIPAISTPTVPPVVAPSIAPIQSPTLPPVGTSSCRQAYLCDSLGRCSWQNVCR